MKKIFKNSILVLLIVVVLVCLFNHYQRLVPLAAEQTYEMYNIDSERKIYQSSDNKGYSSIGNCTIPLNNVALTSVFVGSNNPDNYDVFKDTTKNTYTVLLNNATEFNVNIKFADKKENDTLYYWKANSKVNKSNILEKITISHDSWGSIQEGKNIEKVNINGLDVITGEIGTGAVIVQTSVDGITWSNADKGKYSNGLYTTDVLKNYHGSTQSYTLDGQLIKQGVYVSVSFLYEVRYEYTYYYTTEERYWYQLGFIGGTHTVEHEDKKVEYYNIHENYKFYVIEDNPEVVTFNNLTILDSNSKVDAEGENSLTNVSMSNLLQTMYTNDMTVTGFRINVTANPYLKIFIKRNDVVYELPELIRKDGQMYYELIESGKYDITVASYSKSKSITLYVENSTLEESYQKYFGNKVYYNNLAYGDEFLNYSPGNIYNNMRIFDANSEVPVFIDRLELNLKTLEIPYEPKLYGYVLNISTGKTEIVESSNIFIEEYGEYELVFYNNPKYFNMTVLKEDDTLISGDIKVYKFRFKLVGKDADPTVNEQLLTKHIFKDLAYITPSDYYPLYYGVSRPGKKGDIIIAFSNEKDALDYAKSVVWGKIESYKDSSGKSYWKIPNPENLNEKIISYSGWENARVVNLLAKQMVTTRYFDLSENSSYLTLNKTISELESEGITDLSDLPLEKSIIVWFDEVQRNNSLIENIEVENNIVLDFISNKVSAILKADEKGFYSQIVNEAVDYRFVKDELGLDSYKIVITDSLGVEYTLNYEEGIYTQLRNLNIPTGLVLLKETNIYGLITSQYYVYYINEDSVPGKFMLNINGELYEINENTICDFDVKSMSIVQISDVKDPYSFIKVQYTIDNRTTINYYQYDEVKNFMFTESGEYEISIIDRFGHKLTYQFKIN